MSPSLQLQTAKSSTVTNVSKLVNSLYQTSKTFHGRHYIIIIIIFWTETGSKYMTWFRMLAIRLIHYFNSLFLDTTVIIWLEILVGHCLYRFSTRVAWQSTRGIPQSVMKVCYLVDLCLIVYVSAIEPINHDTFNHEINNFLVDPKDK